MSPDHPCPCGSAMAYASCCGRLHAQHATHGGLAAAAPEALMRSRYAAFVLDLRPYLLASWHASTRPAELEPPEPGLKWLGLDVKRAAMQDAAHGTVEFVARSKLDVYKRQALTSARAIYAAEGYELVRSEASHGFGMEVVNETWELRL